MTDETLSVPEALQRWADAKKRLPKPGSEFHGPGDAEAFTDMIKAELALERAYAQANGKTA